MTEQDVFNRVYAFTFQKEGKTSMDPNDPGNWTGGKRGVGILKGTKYGISAGAYPHLDIQALTPSEAKYLFYRDYWLAPRMHQIPDHQLAMRTFDLGVNCGQGTAIRMLQRAVNTVCCGSVDPLRAAPWRQALVRTFGGGTIRVDGAIGPITLGTIKGCPYKTALQSALQGEAYKHYEKLDPLYVPGWLERLGSRI